MTVRLLLLVRRLLVPATGILAVSCDPDGAPPPGPAVSVSYMVDTLSAEHKEVLDLWRAYLASRPQDFAATPHWSSAEQRERKIFDLGGAFAYSSDRDVAETRGTIFQIAPALPGDSTEYVIRTMFTRPDSFQPERRTFLHRVYAMREDGRWVLSNALPRRTAGWKRTAVERITYVHPPEHVVDTARARGAHAHGARLGVARPRRAARTR